MGNSKIFDGLRERLDKLEWPSIYMFVFIAPIDKFDELQALFRKQDTTTKISKNGNYISVSAKPYMYSTDKVIEIYEKVAKIKGVISL